MLRQANCVKRLTASSGGSLEAKTGESLLIKALYCIPSTNDEYLTLTVDRVTVGYYRVKGKSGNHLSVNRLAYLKRNLMEYLVLHGINVAIPVAAGQTFGVTRYAETGNVIIVYDKADEADHKATDPNGSEAKEYTFIQYAKVGITPAASGDHLIDTAITPAEFPDFPCGKVVPAKHRIELLGIVGCPFNKGEAGPAGFATSFMKFVKDREVLFDEDRNGIPFDAQDAAATALAYDANFTLIGPSTEILLNTNAIANGDPLMFDPPLEFIEGQELNVYLTLVVTGSPTWVDDTDDQAFILRVHRI